MNEHQWQALLNTISGNSNPTPPVGFIIDSPWLPGWAGISTLDYFTSDELWFEANRKAIETFPDVWFLPGFWAEFGMCTEPSAFGAKCSFPENDLPHAAKIIRDVSEIDRLRVPNPQTDGLAPFVLNRLQLNRKRIERLGHRIRFAAARGPLNVASFLMGTTEFLMALRTDPDKVHKLLHIVTEYTVEWLRLQNRRIDSIDGILILDDIVGFCGEPDFQEFAAPYLKTLFNCLDVSVKFFHNDADGRSCAPHLAELGVNLFNFSFLHSLRDMKEWTGGRVTLVGNVPPRDVLAQGTCEEIEQWIGKELARLDNTDRILFSCGGGMPDGVADDKIIAFCNAVRKGKKA